MDFTTTLLLTITVLNRTYTILQAVEVMTASSTGAYLRGELRDAIADCGIFVPQLCDRIAYKLQRQQTLLKHGYSVLKNLGDLLDDAGDKQREHRYHDAQWSKLYDLLNKLDVMPLSDYDNWCKLVNEGEVQVSIVQECCKELCVPSTSEAQQSELFTPEQLKQPLSAAPSTTVEILGTENAPDEEIGWWVKKQQDKQQEQRNALDTMALLEQRMTKIVLHPNDRYTTQLCQNCGEELTKGETGSSYTGEFNCPKCSAKHFMFYTLAGGGNDVLLYDEHGRKGL